MSNIIINGDPDVKKDVVLYNHKMSDAEAEIVELYDKQIQRLDKREIGIDKVLDSFSNFSARLGLGTESMEQGSFYSLTRFTFDYQQITALYRNSWIVQKGIDIPATDMVKHGITIKSEMRPADILKLQKKFKEQNQKKIGGIKWSRLYGGSVGVILIKDAFKMTKKTLDGNEVPIVQLPLEIDDISVDSFKGLYILDRWNGVSPDGELEDDISSYQFGSSRYYTINLPDQSSIKIHHSWLLLFTGIEMPRIERYADSYWGMSELEPVIAEINKRNNTNFSVANLVFQASLRIYKMKDFRQVTSTGSQEFQEEMANRLESLTKYQSSQRATVIDKDDDFAIHSPTFSGLDDILETFMEDIAGAFRIPMDKLWGRPGKGFSGDDKASQRNYNEYIATLQEERMRHNDEKLLQVISKSVLGHIPDDLDFIYTSLYNSDLETRRSEMEQKLNMVLQSFVDGVITDRSIILKEMKQIGEEFDMFSNITDEYIAKIEKLDKLDMDEEESEEVMTGKKEDKDVNSEVKSKDNIFSKFIKKKK